MQGVYVSVSENERCEIIIKAVNRNAVSYKLLLTDENEQPIVSNAIIQTLSSNEVKAMEVAINGGIELPGESFTVIRFK